ncbi:MAG: tRNA (5-methylaminomethyl-2-thiouridine)(34)-methyltransferase MnmD [Candidatus Azobacteroides sp.]|nr:tRNA (5-methylaminomethyl-2-thiouridine)(34)-methyltransferase MnmD [Candidatus Azobacteroides sp.]
MPDIIIEKTKDGSDTLYVPELNEHYHSINGARTESMHVFIKTGLKALPDSGNDIHILEIGFGTGLNVLLTCLEKPAATTVHYTSLELYPLEKELVGKLDFSLSEEEQSLFYKMHDCDWDTFIPVTDTFHLKKWKANFLSVKTFPVMYDLVYFDTFAPDIQPEMWLPENFLFLYSSMKAGGILTTYCAKGQVRRNMQQAGFVVERLPGPPGKREILRATRRK